MKNKEKIKQGKKNRKSGRDFELKVRKDLESKGWIVSKWMNNVEFYQAKVSPELLEGKNMPIPPISAKLIPAKHKFRGVGRPMAIGTGFPDFITYRESDESIMFRKTRPDVLKSIEFQIIGVECKSNGYLTKEEKEKCKWLLDKNIFSKILIASKSGKEISYKEFENGNN